MDFILTIIGPYQRIPGEADTLQINAFHIGSIAIFVCGAESRWQLMARLWWLSESIHRCQFLADSDSIPHKPFDALTLVESDCVCTRRIGMAWRSFFITFYPIQALDWPVIDGDTILTKGGCIRKNRCVTGSANAFVIIRWGHVYTHGSARARKGSFTFIGWAALCPIISIETLAVVFVGYIVDFTSGPILDTVSDRTTWKPPIERSSTEAPSASKRDFFGK